MARRGSKPRKTVILKGGTVLGKRGHRRGMQQYSRTGYGGGRFISPGRYRGHASKRIVGKKGKYRRK